MIRLREAIMVRFGKFQDFHLSFSDGLQVIYGENEAGKSTVQLFLKVMLYGIAGNKKDSKGIKIRERIIPWEEKCAEGILRLEIDGHYVEIRRKFGKTASGDKTEIVDFHTGEPLTIYDAKTLGDQIIGFPEAVFEKTLWLQQNSVSFSGADETLNHRLLNLLETGAEEFSVDGVLKELENEKRAIKARDKRSNPGELDNLWSLREEKIQERYRILSERTQREAEENLLNRTKNALEELKNQERHLMEVAERKKKILELDSKRKRWEEGERALELAKQAEMRDDYRRFSHLSEAIVQNVENLENKLETLDQTEGIRYDIRREDSLILQKKAEEKRSSFSLAIGAVLVVLAAIFAACRMNLWEVLTTISGCFGILLGIIGFTKMHRAKSDAWHASERKKELQIQYQTKQANIESTKKELCRILDEYNCKNAADLREGLLLCKQAKIEAEGYLRTYNALMQGEDIEKFSAQMQEIKQILTENQEILDLDIDYELDKVRQDQISCISKIKEAEGKLSYVFRGGTNPADIETEIRHINQKIDQLEEKQKALQIASQVFEMVAERRKSDFTPKVNEKVNHFLDILTDGKYIDARVSEEYQIRLLPDKTHLYQAEFFSTGTYDQLYFALRLSLLSLLGEGTEPFFLDDFLTSYDDKRAELAMDLLTELGEKHQILFFSCHKRDVDNGIKRKIAIRYLEEERNDGC